MIAIFVCCTRFPDTISYNVGILRMSITAVVTVSSFIICIFVGFEMTYIFKLLTFYTLDYYYISASICDIRDYEFIII